MTEKTRAFDDTLDEVLRDPREAVAYLDAALEEGDTALFLHALQNVARARGMSAVAAEAGLNRESLYRMLSKHGNPELRSLDNVLHTLGLKLSVRLQTKVRSRSRLSASRATKSSAKETRKASRR
ncbi:MAG: addiction module antidote protein [Gammaproteobacteria bacterium]